MPPFHHSLLKTSMDSKKYKYSIESILSLVFFKHGPNSLTNQNCRDFQVATSLQVGESLDDVFVLALGS